MAPWFHSKINPSSSNKNRNLLILIKWVKSNKSVISGKHSTIVSSMSKIRNRTVRVKNRSENLKRILWLGSKPHSNVVIFSFRLLWNFIFKKYEIEFRIRIITKILSNVFKIIKIFEEKPVNWKLTILKFYTNIF